MDQGFGVGLLNASPGDIEEAGYCDKAADCCIKQHSHIHELNLFFRYKKNLKALYLVHPTNFIKILWNIFKPFIRYIYLYKKYD